MFVFIIETVLTLKCHATKLGIQIIDFSIKKFYTYDYLNAKGIKTIEWEKRRRKLNLKVSNF